MSDLQANKSHVRLTGLVISCQTYRLKNLMSDLQANNSHVRLIG